MVARRTPSTHMVILELAPSFGRCKSTLPLETWPLRNAYLFQGFLLGSQCIQECVQSIYTNFRVIKMLRCFQRWLESIDCRRKTERCFPPIEERMKERDGRSAATVCSLRSGPSLKKSAAPTMLGVMPQCAGVENNVTAEDDRHQHHGCRYSVSLLLSLARTLSKKKQLE